MEIFDLEAFKKDLEYYFNSPTYGYIYFIKNTLNNKYYIGQTKNKITKRINQHIRKGHKGSLLHKAIKKYGLDNFEYGTIGEAKSLEELNAKEVELIQIFNSITPNGYNILMGGLGAKNRIPWNKGIKGQTAWNKGKPNIIASKPVIGISISTGKILEFKSAKEAERLEGFNNSWIIQCCKGKQKQHKGFIWRYK